MKTPADLLGRRDIAFLLLGALVTGCASFSYKYYGLNGVSYEQGKLLGPKPELDRPFSDCAPNGEHKNPCVVMFADDFFQLRKDFDQTKMELDDCQRKLP